MNILFLTVSRFDDINARGIYSDLMRELIKRGNDVYIASPTERKFGRPTHLIESNHCQILKIKTLNIQKTNVIEKGIGTLLLERQFENAIKKYWGNINFDLVLYTTPPITFNRIIKSVKKRCGARTYLMLKDIFPQNAVDLGMIKKKSIIYKIFRRKEEKLYGISDRIGCMSPANCSYVIKHNPMIDTSKIELCPNAIEPIEIEKISENERKEVHSKYGIPRDKIIFIYGGNLGKPQGIDFLLKVIEENEKQDSSFIVIIGSGTEYSKIAKWFELNNPRNAKLLSVLPKGEYDNIIRICNVGLIFLDSRFTIPNFPSRLLSYLENSLPVLLATDVNTDIGSISEENGFGYWSENGDLKQFFRNLQKLKDTTMCEKMGLKGKDFLLKNYTVSQVANIILSKK